MVRKGGEEGAWLSRYYIYITPRLSRETQDILTEHQPWRSSIVDFASPRFLPRGMWVISDTPSRLFIGPSRTQGSTAKGNCARRFCENIGRESPLSGVDDFGHFLTSCTLTSCLQRCKYSWDAHISGNTMYIPAFSSLVSSHRQSSHPIPHVCVTSGTNYGLLGE